MASADVVELIRTEHEHIRAAFEQVRGAGEDDREERFADLVTLLAGHEAAEEAVVHPALRDEVPDGGQVARSVLDEEASAEQRLARMDGMERWDGDFAQELNGLEQQVLAHADHEESVELPRLEQHLDERRRRELGQQFEAVRAVGPTRPHPSTPQQPEVRAAVGPLAGMFDRARDAVRDAMPS